MQSAERRKFTKRESQLVLLLHKVFHSRPEILGITSYRGNYLILDAATILPNVCNQTHRTECQVS
jgi:hypothetical protein